MKRRLSPKQDRILEFIGQFLDDHQFPPTIRDIQAGCEISSTSVVDYNLRILERQGYMRRMAEVSRGIELLDGAHSPSRRDITRVPIIGNIAAGEPLPIPDSSRWHDAEETVDLPSFLTKGKSGVFGVRVKGLSMIDALVTDGDLVLLEDIDRPNNGDMVAAWLPESGEVTLKHFHLENGHVRLQPANSTMKPIIVPADKVVIKGRVVGVVRTL